MANNFLIDIVSPALGSATFATELDKAFRNIDENFKRIVSAPYLEGQEGRSIEAVDLPLVEDGELTSFGLTAVREIFMDPEIDSLSDVDSGSRAPIGQHSASEYILEHPSIKVLCKYSPDSGEIEGYVCCAEYYCYIDMRVDDLGHLTYPTIHETFVDYTCQVFGEYDSETGTWTFTRGVMLPTIYYNQSQGYFCWMINGVDTGIRAQGIKGDDGRPPLAAVVRGTGSVLDRYGIGRAVSINVNEFMLTEPTEDKLIGEWESINRSTIQNGDLVCCLFNVTDSLYTGVSYPDMLIGNISVTGESTKSFTITEPDACRFSSLWRSYILFYAFRGIDYMNTDYKKTKAVFVPAHTQGITHAMFQDDSHVQYTQTGGSWSSRDNGGNDDLVFKKVRESRLIGTGSVGNENRMTEPDAMTENFTSVKFIGYNSEVEGTSTAKVGGVPGVMLGVPVGSVVSWLNSGQNRIPDGWYITGETTENVPPVFGLKNVDLSSDDYDMVLVNGETEIARLVFTGISEDGGVYVLGDGDNRFMKIFCTICGYDFPEGNGPLRVETSQNTYNDYVNTEINERWSQFTFQSVDGGTMFYLTKQITQE